jgi:hypothetical protein
MLIFFSCVYFTGIYHQKKQEKEEMPESGLYHSEGFIDLKNNTIGACLLSLLNDIFLLYVQQAESDTGFALSFYYTP